MVGSVWRGFRPVDLLKRVAVHLFNRVSDYSSRPLTVYRLPFSVCTSIPGAVRHCQRTKLRNDERKGNSFDRQTSGETSSYNETRKEAVFRPRDSTGSRAENFRFTRFDQHDQSREISFPVGNCGETRAARVLEFFPCNVDRVVSNSNLICIGGRNGCLPTYKPEQLRAAGSVFARGFRRGGRERSGQIGHTAFLRILARGRVVSRDRRRDSEDEAKQEGTGKKGEIQRDYLITHAPCLTKTTRSLTD